MKTQDEQLTETLALIDATLNGEHAAEIASIRYLMNSDGYIVKQNREFSAAICDRNYLRNDNKRLHNRFQVIKLDNEQTFVGFARTMAQAEKLLAAC